MIEQLMDYMPYISAGLSAITGWLLGKRKSDNDFIADLQESINILSKDNKELREELKNVRDKYDEQTNAYNKISRENGELQREVSIIQRELTRVIENNRKRSRKRKTQKDAPSE